jgi:hypothetical protein
MRRIYKTYHPRENECYREIDGEYRKELETLRDRILEQRKITMKKRAYKRRYYERKKRRGG